MKKSVAITLLIFSALFANSTCQANDLAVGKSAKLNNVVDIDIVPPTDFNFKPMAEIFSMRKREIMKHANLLTGNYVPDGGVFGQAIDRRPWWGSIGQAYYGSGEKSIVGPSIQSQFILNPFLLAGLFGALGVRQGSIEESVARHFPTLIQATNLRWQPKEGKAEVTYLISDWMDKVGQNRIPQHLGGLELINARDLGLNYMYIPPNWVNNVQIDSPMNGAMAIPHYIHCGGSCGYPGGCNNCSPAVPWLDNIQITSLPAKMYLLFWKNTPANIRQSPDMTFVMNFQ